MTENTTQPTNSARRNVQAQPNGPAQPDGQAQPNDRAEPNGQPQRVDAAAMRRRSGIFRVVNVPMRAVLSLPFPTPLSRNLMLVRYTGRKTGRVYRQPLSYARDGEALLTPGGGRWTLNMEGGRPVRIRLRGRDVSARPELVREPSEVERLLDVIVRENPPAARYIPLPRLADGRLEPSALAAAIDHGFAIVRWNLT
jgi:F420H(2)-dependent quinone reductase